jgi:hypothetical protein
VDYEGDADYLIMTIYLLFSACCMRLLYLSMPKLDSDQSFGAVLQLVAL